MSEPQRTFLIGEKDAGKRLDQFLKEKIPGLSRTKIKVAIATRVKLSWEATPRPSRVVVPGESVYIEPKPSLEQVVPIVFEILREGEGWLAIDKPAGIPVHPAGDIVENSLIRALRRQMQKQKLRLAHRLDAQTSGVLLVASTSEAARYFANAFTRHEVQKEYLAWVHGKVAEDQGEITDPIGKHPSSSIHVRLAAHGADAKPARTRWQLERTVGDYTLLRLMPQEGRRHQLRVHCESMGHPIVGDMLYGRPDEDFLDLIRGIRDARKESGEPDRQLLHCARMSFTAPDSKKFETIESDPPTDFQIFEESI